MSKKLGIEINKILEARAEVEHLTQLPIASAEKIKQLKQIEDTKYKPLIQQLAYTKEPEGLKALATVLKDLGGLTRQIAELSDDLKCYTDAAIFYQYVITIIQERIDPHKTDASYTQQIVECYKELAAINSKIISLSKLTTEQDLKEITGSTIEKETKVNNAILSGLRELSNKHIKAIEASRKLSENTKDAIKKQGYEDLYVSKSRELFSKIAGELNSFLAKL